MVGKTRLTKVQRDNNSKTFKINKEAKNKIVVSFVSLREAKTYLKSMGYYYCESYNMKEDRFSLYKNGSYFMQLMSTFDYLSTGSIEMGTVWKIKQL